MRGDWFKVTAGTDGQEGGVDRSCKPHPPQNQMPLGEEKEERKKHKRLKLNIHLTKTELSKIGYLNQKTV